jgi:hypothetical protein
LSPRRLGLSLLVFLGIIALGAWPAPAIALGVSAAYSWTANPVLERITFGHRGHARLQTLPEIKRRESDNVTGDTLLALSVDGYRGTVPLGISVRRDVYLPLLILVALLLAFPRLRPGQRLTCLALAVPITVAAGIAANALVAAWTFSTQLRGVYPPQPVTRRIIAFAYGALLSPPGNRFIAPLALGAGLIAWQLKQRRRDRPGHGGV